LSISTADVPDTQPATSFLCAIVSHAEKYKNKLEKAQILIYKDRKGHFTALKFQEIINLIKKRL